LRLRDLVLPFFGASAATLLYGALVEARRLQVDRHVLPLPSWPKSLSGYKIALLADFHLNRWNRELNAEAVAAALEAEPDAVALAGDFVGYWSLDKIDMLGELFAPLEKLDGKVVAVPGNHDYYGGDASLLKPILNEFGIKLLRNEVVSFDGISWVGIDSETEGRADPYTPMLEQSTRKEPAIVVWHEPDVVERLPRGADLMLSGHSHGGQFTFPWGWTPMHTDLGRRFVRGFYPEAPTPIYVSRGIGTTGPPSRLCCPPEVAILTLTAA
jgi:uncharacterized protein